MNERTVAAIFHDILDGPEPTVSVSAVQGLMRGRAILRRRHMLQGSVTAAAVVAILAGSTLLSNAVDTAAPVRHQPASELTASIAPKAPIPPAASTARGAAADLQPAPRFCRKEWAAHSHTAGVSAPNSETYSTYAKCLVPAAAQANAAIRQIAARYGAARSDAWVSDLSQHDGYPFYGAGWNFANGGVVTVWWRYDDRAPRPTGPPVCLGPGPTPDRLPCALHILADGSTYKIFGPPSGNEVTVARHRVDGLRVWVIAETKVSPLTQAQMIELSSSPLLKG